MRKNQLTGGNVRGRREQDCRNRTTNSDFIPHWRDQTSRAQQCRDRPAGKPPRQWRHAAGKHPAISATLTPGIRLGGPSRASAMTTRQG